MKTILFLTKPEEHPEQVRGNSGHTWCCSKSTNADDRILVYVTNGKGICCQWRAISGSKPDPNKRYPYVCEVEFVRDFKPPITLQELRGVVTQQQWNAPYVNMRCRPASIIPALVAEKILALRPMHLHELEQKFWEDVEASQKLSSAQRRERLASAPKYPRKTTVTTEIFDRNIHVIAEVLFRANGICECCKLPAPFKRAKKGTPYLEVHHKKWLADGGEDTVENAVALCPNCHRKAHYG